MFFKTFPNLSWFFISLFSPTVARNCFESYDWQILLSPDNLADCETYVYQIKITRCHRIFLNSSVSGKSPPPSQKITPYENCPCESSPLNFSPRKLPPWKIPSPLINHTNERKNKITNFFALKKAVQYNILIKITNVLFDTQMISQKILGLDTFFTEWKKSKNWTKAQIAKWHLLASCTSQGELKLGSQIIKFGK